ncbi:type II toxin-antitoxin system RelE/ParE family toxin [Desulfovibrio sp. JC010]|uniref:type II toxin-antitoxin system RelE/ParE family toxin n=1 Tax=Desulfovibrio sp. JC010 TaxID=2593641 RepID=UPI0013D8D2E9|nr:type II toxin-antitoxin system RelE/ParE family toxin [Desulfovibrio sp. JC010]NDV28623.1 type II toxin-antitoxin system RelE/ParE family toxin [Desulfovibrio sp. JC010]
MAQFTLLRKAEDDLIEIWKYIAEDDQDAATRTLRSLEKKFHLLAANTKLGPARPDIAPDLRYFVDGNYLILYREAGDGIEIVRVVHGARNLKALFENKNSI